MPSSYTSRLRLTLPATGELNNVWGNTVNNEITQLVESSVAGVATISTWGGAGVAYTLSTNNGAADEARCMIISASGAPGENKNIICPNTTKMYVVYNGVSGGFSITIKTAAGAGVTVDNGKSAIVWCNGTSVVEALTQFPAITLTGGTVNGVVYVGAGNTLQSSSGFVFSGTNVGLGTTTPGTYTGYTTFAINNAVNGGLIDLMTAGTRHLTLFAGTAASVVGTASNTDLRWQTNNLVRGGITSDGRFAFNKTTANRIVDVAGGAMTSAVSVTFSTTPTFDAAAANIFLFGVLTANVTSMTVNNPQEGQFISIRFKQDATGGRTVAVPAGAAVAGTVNATASKVSYLSMTYNAADARWEGSWMNLP